MLLDVALFLVGLAVLVAGADRAVRAAAELALYYGVSTFFVGVTVISVGTSLPEMATSVTAALRGAGDIVVGNIVGSETAQITLALGVVALVAPIAARRRDVGVYGGAMVLAMVIMWLTLEDGVVGRSEGFLMMVAYAAFVHDLYTSAGGEEVAEAAIDAEPPRRALPWVAVGLAATVLGAAATVEGGVAVARTLGVPDYLVGLLTGLGTTLPEVVVGAVAAREGDGGLSVGAILGSNITDPVLSLGVGALVADVALSDPAAVTGSLAYMLGVSVLVLAAMYWRRGVDRPLAVACLLLYAPSLFLA